MLEAFRENIFSLSLRQLFSVVYKVSNDQKNIGRICLNLFLTYKARLDINGKIYKIYPNPGQGIRFGFMSGVYVLESDGVTIAQYESTRSMDFIGGTGISLINIEGKLTYNNKSFLLKTKSFFSQHFTLLEHDQEVGNLHAESNTLLRKLVANLPGDIPIEIQAFLLWVILCGWKVAREMGG